jgi:hypothetical protein
VAFAFDEKEQQGQESRNPHEQLLHFNSKAQKILTQPQNRGYNGVNRLSGILEKEVIEHGTKFNTQGRW